MHFAGLIRVDESVKKPKNILNIIIINQKNFLKLVLKMD